MNYSVTVEMAANNLLGTRSEGLDRIPALLRPQDAHRGDGSRSPCG